MPMKWHSHFYTAHIYVTISTNRGTHETADTLIQCGVCCCVFFLPFQLNDIYLFFSSKRSFIIYYYIIMNE